MSDAPPQYVFTFDQASGLEINTATGRPDFGATTSNPYGNIPSFTDSEGDIEVYGGHGADPAFASSYYTVPELQAETPNPDQPNYVLSGDGASLSDILADGSSIAQALSTGFDSLSLMEGALNNAKASRFVDAVAHALGAYDNLASDASAASVFLAQNTAFAETAESFSTGAQVLGVAANLFSVYEGVAYLKDHPIDPNDQGSIEALAKLTDGGIELAGLVQNAPGFGAAGPMIANAISAYQYASSGDYADAAASIAKGITIFGFAGIGQLLDPKDGANVGASLGGAAADLAQVFGNAAANHATDPILNTQLGQQATTAFYNTFLKTH